MSRIDEIEEKLAATYKAGEQSQELDIPTTQQALEWKSFSRIYINAATELNKHGMQYILPRLQLTGQAVEAALKAYLLSKSIEPKHTHNLVSLYKQCESNGIGLDDKLLSAIVHLNHYYFRDLATETKYKSRYPTPTAEALGGAVPNNETYISIVNILSGQENASPTNGFNDTLEKELDPVDLARLERKPRKVREGWSSEKNFNYIIFKVIILAFIFTAIGMCSTKYMS
jgi:HEPN domain-containing protein